VAGFDSLQGQEIFFLSRIPSLVPTHPPIELGSVSAVESCRVVKLTTHFYLMVELHLHFSIRLHGVMLDYLRTRKTLPFYTSKV
jgi:hypothetical protein